MQSKGENIRHNVDIVKKQQTRKMHEQWKFLGTIYMKQNISGITC